MKKVLAALLVVMVAFGVYTNKGAAYSLVEQEFLVSEETKKQASEMEELIERIYNECDPMYGLFVINDITVTPHKDGDMMVHVDVTNIGTGEPYVSDVFVGPHDYEGTMSELWLGYEIACQHNEGAC